MNEAQAEKKEVTGWRCPPEPLTLGSDEVHVFRAGLDQPAARLQSLFATLAADERARAERFYFQRDRSRFVAARGVLRTILSCYLALKPSELRFDYGAQGKPAVANSCGRMLRFNISHSYSLALVAVTWGREIGVDLERVSAEVAKEQVAERFFSPREVAELRSLPVERHTEAFFQCWTRKEAYIKARAVGLSLPLDQFDVSLVPGEPVALLSTQGDRDEASRWSLRELVPGPSYFAALAVEGHDWQLRTWQWTE
jgi:4'-phosphopantetheinyl transferase